MKTSPNSFLKGHFARLKQAGFSSAEALVSLVISGVAVAGGLTMNSHELRLVKSTREAGAATGVLEERVEQLRTANWRQLTDTTFLTDSYFATLPKSMAALGAYTEQIKVTAWPDESVATPILIEKKAKSAPRVVLDGSDLAEQRLAKVDVHVTWLGKDQRVRVRELSTMISNGGISRMNLPAMGTDGSSGGPDAPTPTPTPETTTEPGATPSPTQTDDGNGDGNGNGRGNVGGESGKA